MRVDSVSCKVCRPQCRRSSVRQKTMVGPTTNPNEIAFNGKFGRIVGGTIGTGAVLAASVLLAPAAICLVGAGLVTGLVGGDVAEDAINESDKPKN